ncbi:MAG: alpha/beta fold hydrolase [Lewinellaceae bacterium]|nr:alpha/beta fold hydrolase [Lewinellaceae bacterium]
MLPLYEYLQQQGREVYKMNLSGHGQRVVPPIFSMIDFAAEVGGLLTAKGLRQVDVFGYSMGGYVALTLALQRPELVGSITTLGTKFHWNPETSAREVARLNPDKIKEKVPQFAEALALQHGETNWVPLMERTAELLHSLGHGHALTDEDFRRIQQPVTILLGSEDNMVTREESEHVAGVLPHGTFRLLEGVKHPIEGVEPGGIWSLVFGL